MKERKRRRSSRKAVESPERVAASSTGKQTISPNNHDSNVGQREDDSETQHEVHPDDHENDYA